VCSYSRVYDEEFGTPRCQDEFLNNDQHIGMVNCSGHCSKEWYYASDEHYMIRRRCQESCHSHVIEGRQEAVYCCAENLCNTADSFHGSNMLMCMLSFVFISLNVVSLSVEFV